MRDSKPPIDLVEPESICERPIPLIVAKCDLVCAYLVEIVFAFTLRSERAKVVVMHQPDTAIIVGNGQQARVIASLLPHRNKRFLVERDPGPGELLQANVFALPPDQTADYFIGIGNNAARRRLFDRLCDWGVTPASCIAANAWIAADVRLGRGLFLGPGVIVMTGCTIGDNVIVNTASSVDHDCTIDEDTQITAGVTIASSITVGPRSYFGVKSGVVPGVAIGSEVMVMAGAMVISDVPHRTKVGGVPARPHPFNSHDLAYVQFR